MLSYSTLLHLLRGPLILDEDLARKARILRAIIYSAFVLTLIMVVAVGVFIPDSIDSWIILIAVLAWEFIVIVTMLGGMIGAACILLTIGLMVNALATSFMFGGVRQVTFSSYVIVILTGGILLGKRTGFFLAGIGIIAGLAMLYSEMIGWLPPSDPLDSPTTWAAATVTFIWAAVVLYMALKNFEEELTRRGQEVEKRRLAQEQITILHHETEEHLHRVQALHTIDQAITTGQQLPSVLQVLLEQTMAQIHVDAGAVSLLSSRDRTLQVAARLGLRSDLVRPIGQIVLDPFALEALNKEQLVQIPNLASQSASLLTAGRESDEGVVGYWATPLFVKGEVRGLLEAFNRSPLEDHDHQIDFFLALGTQAAIAVDNAGLFQELQRSNAELTLSYDATIEGWSRALELRDGGTEGHSRRVTDLTLNLARRFGFSDPELAHIRRGALLHDIGKMAIPDSILLKPGPLDPSEWEIMRAHPTYALQLLSPIAFLRPALDIPYCHHEKWDGTGYPRGLKGEEIPLSSRIFAVVDVWDALSSDRSYRKAWSRKAVLDYLISQTGKHFDPQVLTLFISLVQELDV